VPWSTEKVFETTIKKIDSLRLSYEPLVELSDLDTIENMKEGVR
jgi:glycosyltransferase A (GT-A) superfamily protein (DUF2064 family)